MRWYFSNVVKTNVTTKILISGVTRIFVRRREVYMYIYYIILYFISDLYRSQRVTNKNKPFWCELCCTTDYNVPFEWLTFFLENQKN